MKQNHKEKCNCGMCKAVRGETNGKYNPHFGHYKYNITKKFLIKEYSKNNKLKSQIAKEVGCSPQTIYNYLIKYNIPRRKPGNVWLGIKRPEHSKRMKGRKNLGVSKANKNRIGEKALGYKHGETLIKHYCINSNCNDEISYSNWKYGNKRCKSCSNRLNMIGNIPWNKNKKCPQFSGKKNSRFGKRMKPNWVKYKNTWFRSNWELLFARFLDLSNIKWLYEPKVFNLGNMTYCPDFYLPKFDCYIEIKGYFSDYAKKKFKSFKRKYPNINIKLLMQKNLQKMGVL